MISRRRAARKLESATPPASSPAAAGNSTGGAPAPGEHGGNPHEVARRSVKREALISVLLVDAELSGEHFLSLAFAQKLAEAGQTFWVLTAAQAGCAAPSLTTQQEVIAFFRNASQRASERASTLVLKATSDAGVSR